jgi:hypothetical protein
MIQKNIITLMKGFDMLNELVDKENVTQTTP